MMQTRNNRIPNGPTEREIQPRAILATRICDYNQANLFLASVIRKRVSKEQALFPLLHQYIIKNIHMIANDAHLFQEKRRALIHANPIHQNDTSLCDMLNGTQVNTWEKHLNFHATFSQDNAVQSSAQLYDAFLKTLGTSSSTTLVVANAASLTNDISAINESSIAGHKPCLIHTSGKHTNDECFKQKDIRANSDMTSYKLIAALTKLYQENKVEHTRTQALKKQSQAVTLARSKANPSKKKRTNGKSRSKSQETSSHSSPSKPSKLVLDDESTAAASKGSFKSSKKRKDDSASTQKAHMARQSDDKESIDGYDEDNDYDLNRALGIEQYPISAADYAVMSSTTSQSPNESTTVPSGTHSVSMAKGGKGGFTSVAKRFRKFPSTEESAPRDDNFTQFEVDQPTNGTSIHKQPADTGHDNDTSVGSSSSKDTEQIV
jgi:hypothetical protein